MVTEMKKQYKKPEVSFVDFTLSSSIAETCAYGATHDSGNTCVYEFGGWTHFSSSNGACIFQDSEEFCYHNPSMNNNLFGS